MMGGLVGGGGVGGKRGEEGGVGGKRGEVGRVGRRRGEEGGVGRRRGEVGDVEVVILVEESELPSIRGGGRGDA